MPTVDEVIGGSQAFRKMAFSGRNRWPQNCGVGCERISKARNGHILPEWMIDINPRRCLTISNRKRCFGSPRD
jgi:hypothetical protein